MSDTPVDQAPPVAAPAVAAAPTPEPAAVAESTPDFDWSGWNGDSGSLPNDYQEVGGRVSDWYKSTNMENEEEIQNLRSMYSALINGDEDPRISQYGEELEKLKSEYSERNTAFDDLQGKYDNLTESTVNSYIDRFWEEHKELADDEAKLEIFAKFLEPENEYGGAWDGYAAAKLMALPEDAIEIAVQAKKDGVSDKYAIKLAEAHVQINAPAQAEATGPSPKDMAKAAAAAAAKVEAEKPRPAAKLTNGATGAARPQVAKKSMSDVRSFDEMRNLAAARALRVHSGGKR